LLWGSALIDVPIECVLIFRGKNDGVTELFPQLLFLCKGLDIGLSFVDVSNFFRKM
jgi:hypothetical protein